MASFERLSDCCGVTELTSISGQGETSIRNLLDEVTFDVLDKNQTKGGRHLCIATVTDKYATTIKALESLGFVKHREFRNASSQNRLQMWSKLLVIPSNTEEEDGN